MNTYTSLTKEAEQLKAYLQPCIDLAERLEDIEQELSLYEGLDLTETEKALREERRQVYARLCQYRNEVYDLIQNTPSLSVNERAIIRLRYLRGIKWENISLTVRRSRQDVYRKHRKALNKMAESNRKKGKP